MKVSRIILALIASAIVATSYAASNDSIKLVRLEQTLQKEIKARESLKNELAIQKDLIKGQAVVIDSLRSAIDQNARNIKTTADEMGVKKTPAVKQAPVAKQSASAVKQEAKKTAVNNAGKAAASAGTAVKQVNGSKGLKAGQVVSLADEMGYKKQPAKQAAAPAKQAPAKNSGKKNSAIGPKITDPNEIKRRASQVVITEAVQ